MNVNVRLCVKPLEEHIHINSLLRNTHLKTTKKKSASILAKLTKSLLFPFWKLRSLHSWPYDCGKTRIRPVCTRVSGWWAGDCACSESPLWHQDPNNSLRHEPRWECNHHETWGHSTAGPKSDGTQEISNIRCLLQMTSYQWAVIYKYKKRMWNYLHCF